MAEGKKMNGGEKGKKKPTQIRDLKDRKTGRVDEAHARNVRGGGSPPPPPTPQ